MERAAPSNWMKEWRKLLLEHTLRHNIPVYMTLCDLRRFDEGRRPPGPETACATRFQLRRFPPKYRRGHTMITVALAVRIRLTRWPFVRPPICRYTPAPRLPGSSAAWSKWPGRLARWSSVT